MRYEIEMADDMLEAFRRAVVIKLGQLKLSEELKLSDFLLNSEKDELDAMELLLKQLSPPPQGEPHAEKESSPLPAG